MKQQEAAELEEKQIIKRRILEYNEREEEELNGASQMGNWGQGATNTSSIRSVKYVNPVTKLCIVRVSREDHQKVWAAMTMVRCIGKIPVSFNLLDMSVLKKRATLLFIAQLPQFSSSIIIAFTFSRKHQGFQEAALECDEAKFEQYKVAAGDHITAEIIQSVESCFEKIRGLES
ncbi:unnamed protein product [Miscanthus lutarioriparius]|uniref:Uncharacterized protein n=1 Tax=Miscanthus lutarioriparius TaxID=422564 RepID=A0A811P4X1_9POAL|nr:unnamed protein product [Miscanthus lutarioriparius]